MKLTDAIALCVLLQVIVYAVGCTYVLIEDCTVVVPVELSSDLCPLTSGENL